MKKFTNFCIKYAIFITENYISMDWSDYTKLGKIYYYPFWLIRSCVIWLICPIFYFEYSFKQSSWYEHYKMLQNDPEYQAQMTKALRFLNF